MFILEGRYAVVLPVIAVAAFTDALDGFLAKRFGWETELGKHLDPLADKLLLVVMFVTLSMQGLVPWWLTTVVLLRDLTIIFGGLAYRAWFGPLQGRPTFASKLNTLTQIVFSLAVVTAAAFAWPPPWCVTALGALVFISTCISGIDYVLTYTRRAVQVSHARSARSH